jgi:hypothetical protein
MDADYPRPGPAAGKNAVIKAFPRYSVFNTRVPCVVSRAHVNCAAFLAAV